MARSLWSYISESWNVGGHKVHWPTRDTKQDDPTFKAILNTDQIHVWGDEVKVFKHIAD